MVRHYSLLKMVFFLSFAALAVCLLPKTGFAQLTVSNDTTICPPECVTLEVLDVGKMGTNVYSVTQSQYGPDPFGGGNNINITIDDTHTGPIGIGFPFCFFDQTYTQLVISTNGYITFNTGNAGAFSPFITAAVPTATPATVTNSIMLPWQDIDPSVGGQITTQLLGTAPNRRFVVSFSAVPYFSCNSLTFTGQVKLFEGTNIIETHILNKPVCNNWNSGNAVHAIQNQAGTIAYPVPGRNNTVWTANNDAWRWVPIPPLPLVTWLEVGVGVIGTGMSITVCPTATTTYQAEVDLCSGYFTDFVVVTVECHSCQPPEMDSVAVSCFGACDGMAIAHANLDSSNAPFQFSWLDQNLNLVRSIGNDSTGSDTARMLCPGTYTVLIFDSAQCVATNTVVVTEPAQLLTSVAVVDAKCNELCDGQAMVTPAGGTSPYTISWLDGGTGFSRVALCPGQYDFTVTDDHDCTSEGSLIINRPPPVNISVGGGTTICIGGDATLFATATGGAGSPYFYQWNTAGTGTPVTVNPTQSQVYNVIAIDANGCQSESASVSVQVLPPLSVSVSGGAEICPGDVQTLQALVSGGDGNYTFNWSTGQSGPVVTSTFQQTTTVQVVVSDGCTTPSVSSELTVIVHPLPLLDYRTNIREGCVPLTINFILNIQEEGAVYDWQYGDGNAENDVDEYSPHVYQNSGCYDIELHVVSQHGCENRVREKCAVEAWPVPYADFECLPEELSSLEAYGTFLDQSVGANAWEWTISDADNPQLSSTVYNQHNVTHEFERAGRYLIFQEVTNNYGCTDTISKYLVVTDETAIWVPNAFTPDGDGINDTWGVKSFGMDGFYFELHVLDRWGNRVFSAKSKDQLWDGTYHGEVVPLDVYSWVIQYADVEGRDPLVMTGHVTVVR